MKNTRVRNLSNNQHDSALRTHIETGKNKLSQEKHKNVSEVNMSVQANTTDQDQ